jgi:hypothetical protein
MPESLSPEERGKILDEEVMRYTRQGYQVRAHPDHRSARQAQEVQLHLGARVVLTLRDWADRLSALLLGQKGSNSLPGS